MCVHCTLYDTNICICRCRVLFRNRLVCHFTFYPLFVWQIQSEHHISFHFGRIATFSGYSSVPRVGDTGGNVHDRNRAASTDFVQSARMPENKLTAWKSARGIRKLPFLRLRTIRRQKSLYATSLHATRMKIERAITWWAEPDRSAKRDFAINLELYTHARSSQCTLDLLLIRTVVAASFARAAWSPNGQIPRTGSHSLSPISFGYERNCCFSAHCASAPFQVLNNRWECILNRVSDWFAFVRVSFGVDFVLTHCKVSDSMFVRMAGQDNCTFRCFENHLDMSAKSFGDRF